MNKTKFYQAPEAKWLPMLEADVLCASPFNSYGPKGDEIDLYDDDDEYYQNW